MCPAIARSRNRTRMKWYIRQDTLDLVNQLFVEIGTPKSIPEEARELLSYGLSHGLFQGIGRLNYPEAVPCRFWLPNGLLSQLARANPQGCSRSAFVDQLLVRAAIHYRANILTGGLNVPAETGS